MLVLDGRRSLFTAWPPDAACERCLQTPGEGYAGPAPGDSITYPDAAVRFVCEPCARKLLDLDPGELGGHACGPRCTLRGHEKIVMAAAPEMDGLDRAGRVARYSKDYGRRGWRILDVVPAPHGPKAIGGEAWAILFTMERPAW